MDRFDAAECAPPGCADRLSGPFVEVERLEWRIGDDADPADLLASFLGAHADAPVALLLGASGCAAVAGLPTGRPSPVPAVPELVAVALRPGPPGVAPARLTPVGEWVPSWSDAEHAASVETVRAAIERGDVYQASVVGHRSAPHRSEPRAVAVAVARSAGATYGGTLTGEGWAVGSASPEQLVRVRDRRITTEPVKGTRVLGPGSREQLLASAKDRAEHIMIVDLARNDLARVAVTGSVEVEQLYVLREWSGLWHARSVVAGQLADGIGVVDVLRAVAPGGSVTGAPKRAACGLLAALEPTGRGPAMGAFGLVYAGGMDLGLTIRTVAVDDDRVHLWAGGGITWGSDPAEEVAEAHAKARPLLAALARREP